MYETVVVKGRKGVFYFARKERTAVFLLLGLGTVIYFIPQFFKAEKKTIPNDAFAKEIAQLKISIDTVSYTRNYRRNDDDFEYDRPNYYTPSLKATKGELFEFDPNTLNEEGWKRLGLRDKTIQTIQKFVAKGYKFRKVEDIKRIYGLSENEAERLIPFIRIKEDESLERPSYVAISNPTPSNLKVAVTRKIIIDINSADTAAFISLPGIGSKLASRIVNFRDKLGGFNSVQQVAETYGLADSTFQKVRPMLVCSNPVVKTFDINATDVNELKAHPYIKWNIANAIVSYRQQHGNYKSLNDLKKINIISDELFNKIAPYLKVL